MTWNPEATGGNADLGVLIDPARVAIIGASDRPFSLGQRAVANLLDHSDFRGDAYLVNPTRAEIHGRPTYASVLDTPDAPDVAALVVPAAQTMPVLRTCAERGVRFAVVFTSGFGETGPEGKHVEREMATLARDSGMRIYGPNSPGLCNNNKRLGLMFSPSFRVDQRPGPIGLATQGGGVGRCFLQGMERGVGVGLWASTGNEVDLTVADFIRYMADADDIEVIATAVEGVRDGDAFVDAVMLAAERGKPVVALKVGRSEYGARAVASHTGSISGTAEVNSAVLRQTGVVEVDDMDELIDTAALFARAAPSPTGRVAVYGFSGGGCAMTADAVGAAGLELSTFSDETERRLAEILPDYAAWSNPVDATSDILTRPEIGSASLQATCDDPDTDVVVYPFPCDYADLTGSIAQSIVEVQATSSTPVVPVWMSDRLGPGYTALVEGGMVPIGSVRRGSKAVRRWRDRGRWQAPHGWRPLGDGDLAGTRVVATEPAAKALLADAGIRVPRSRIASSAREAASCGSELGYPVVVKLVSASTTHKTDVGGVVVGVDNDDAAVAAFEKIRADVLAATGRPVEHVLVEDMAPAGLDVLVGVTRDPVFGPVLTYGLGGVFVEVFSDVARRLLPVDGDTARELIREPRSAQLLAGARGRPVADVDALADLLVAVSGFVEKHRDTLIELELNPVRVLPAGRGVIALDAVLVTTSGADRNEARQP